MISIKLCEKIKTNSTMPTDLVNEEHLNSYRILLIKTLVLPKLTYIISTALPNPSKEFTKKVEKYCLDLFGEKKLMIKDECNVQYICKEWLKND